MWGSRREMREVLRLLDRLDAAVVVRDPGTARSVEEFEGMRRLLMSVSKNHRSHVVDLISLSEVIETGGSIEVVRGRLNEYLSSLGIERSTDVSRPEEFVFDAGGSGRLECSKAAVVEVLADGRRIVHKRGSAAWVAEPDVVVAESTEPGMTSGSGETPSGDGPVTAPVGRLRPALVAVAATALVAGFLLGRVGGSDDPAEPAPTTIEPAADEATETTAASTTTTTVPATTTTEEGK